MGFVYIVEVLVRKDKSSPHSDTIVVIVVVVVTGLVERVIVGDNPLSTSSVPVRRERV